MMVNISKLFASKDIYGVQDDELFVSAMRENCEFQYKHCREYNRILKSKNFKPEDIKSMDDLVRLPFIPTVTFKRHRLLSVPESKAIITTTSSGTSTGRVSRVSMDIDSLFNGLRMILKTLPPRGIVSPIPCNYVVLGYKPHKSNKTAVTKSTFASTLLAPGIHRTFALEYKDGKYVAVLDKVVKDIVKYSKSHFPLRIMGFPSYAYFVMKMMDEQGISVKLPKHSIMVISGGWKQFYAEEVDKTILYRLAKKVLGLEEDQIIELFSAVEHPVSYCDCKQHHFHIPAYSRVLIRDVNTLEPVPNGQVGLVNLMTPMVLATPLLSVMTDDLGILHDGGSCECGAKSPYLEIIGRVGLKEIKTCAANAAEAIKDALK